MWYFSVVHGHICQALRRHHWRWRGAETSEAVAALYRLRRAICHEDMTTQLKTRAIKKPAARWVHLETLATLAL